METPQKARSPDGTSGEWTGLVDTSACGTGSRVADSDVGQTSGSDSSSSTDALLTFKEWGNELQDARRALRAHQPQALEHTSENAHAAADNQARSSECIAAETAHHDEPLAADTASPAADVSQSAVARTSLEAEPIVKASTTTPNAQTWAEYIVTALFLIYLCAPFILAQLHKHSSPPSSTPSPSPMFDLSTRLETEPKSKTEFPVQRSASDEWAKWEEKRQAFGDGEPKWSIEENASAEWKAWGEKYRRFWDGEGTPERVPEPDLDVKEGVSTVWDEWKNMFEELVDGPLV